MNNYHNVSVVIVHLIRFSGVDRFSRLPGWLPGCCCVAVIQEYMRERSVAFFCYSQLKVVMVLENNTEMISVTHFFKQFLQFYSGNKQFKWKKTNPLNVTEIMIFPMLWWKSVLPDFTFQSWWYSQPYHPALTLSSSLSMSAEDVVYKSGFLQVEDSSFQTRI